MSACPLVILACESLHVCTMCIWSVNTQGFVRKFFYALYINFYSFIHSYAVCCSVIFPETSLDFCEYSIFF